MMKRTILFTLLYLIASTGIAMAVQGVCSNCHTMHNSQGGTSMLFTTMSGTDPQPMLLKGDCVGCHSMVGTENFNSAGAPAVLNTAEPTAGVLAGGNFHWVKEPGTDNLGHNVDYINSRDGQFLTDPPGWDDTYRSAATAWDANQLTCAGIYGCHGDPTIDGTYAGIKGAHHSNLTGTTTGLTTGTSYRFLYGITGVEDDGYETPPVTSANSNTYKGADNSNEDASTISYLCATCHGVFHDRSTISDEATASSPWLRHPTDILLPQTGEYGSYNPTTNYVNEAPVAYTDPTAPTRDTAVVMCLSCHRAHGMGNIGSGADAGFADILRFDYTGMVAGSGNQNDGCLTCHNTKD